MAQRTPTIWKRNADKVDALTTYSASTVTYSSPVIAYSNPDTALDDFGKIAQSWNRPAKLSTGWAANPPSQANRYPYDSATKLYDSATDTYDGVVTTDLETTNQNKPTSWRGL